ncbi:hypothetical protein [Methylorubrum aminovorans]|uniref:hypothetical protein n=1 Tax=Methylorubrum aminovorans TaxID=269069 RepID=UPI0024E08E72|nr:hypothetical protein [Methylorubrum aminovorans]
MLGLVEAPDETAVGLALDMEAVMTGGEGQEIAGRGISAPRPMASQERVQTASSSSSAKASAR